MLAAMSLMNVVMAVVFSTLIDSKPVQLGPAQVADVESAPQKLPHSKPAPIDPSK